MIAAAEALIAERHRDYALGSVRVILVFENCAPSSASAKWLRRSTPTS